MEWHEFYGQRVGKTYVDYSEARYRPFIDELKKRIYPTDSVREEGCGIGTFSVIVKRLFPAINLSVCDRSPFMLAHTRNNFNLHDIRPENMFLHDIKTASDKADVLFSHGVLEHFTRTEIKNIIDRQKKECRKLIHYVPTDGYKSQAFGDELLMSPAEWSELTKPKTMRTFNAGKDLILTW